MQQLATMAGVCVLQDCMVRFIKQNFIKHDKIHNLGVIAAYVAANPNLTQVSRCLAERSASELSMPASFLTQLVRSRHILWQVVAAPANQHQLEVLVMMIADAPKEVRQGTM